MNAWTTFHDNSSNNCIDILLKVKKWDEITKLWGDIVWEPWMSMDHEFCAYPSCRCWDISVWTKVVDRPTLPSIWSVWFLQILLAFRCKATSSLYFETSQLLSSHMRCWSVNRTFWRLFSCRHGMTSAQCFVSVSELCTAQELCQSSISTTLNHETLYVYHPPHLQLVALTQKHAGLLSQPVITEGRYSSGVRLAQWKHRWLVSRRAETPKGEGDVQSFVWLTGLCFFVCLPVYTIGQISVVKTY